MVQVDLITGFLGAGKTTFLRRYVRYLVEQGHNVCILENDFGAVNVDAMLVQDLLGPRCDLETISGGCDCDTHQRRMRTKLIAMAMRGFDRVVVEPSGIFDVDEFFDVLRDDPLDRWYHIGNVIAIVDAMPKPRGLQHDHFCDGSLVWLRWLVHHLHTHVAVPYVVAVVLERDVATVLALVDHHAVGIGELASLLELAGVQHLLPLGSPQVVLQYLLVVLVVDDRTLEDNYLHLVPFTEGLGVLGLCRHHVVEGSRLAIAVGAQLCIHVVSVVQHFCLRSYHETPRCSRYNFQTAYEYS